MASNTGFIFVPMRDRERYVNLSLSDELEYLTTVNVLNTRITMRCGYNLRLKKRWIYLTDSQGYVLLPQTFLSANKTCELNFNAEQNGLDFSVTLVRIDKGKPLPARYDYKDWSKYFTLLFLGKDVSVTEKFHKNRLNRLVGG